VTATWKDGCERPDPPWRLLAMAVIAFVILLRAAF